MKSISSCLLPCIALVGIVYSCTTKDNLPTFKEVFPEILAVVDSPEVLTKKQSLGNGKLQMLCYNKWKENYEPMAFIVFGKNVKVQAVKNKYNYIMRICSTYIYVYGSCRKFRLQEQEKC